MQALANQPSYNNLPVGALASLCLEALATCARPLLYHTVTRKMSEAEPITKLSGSHGLILANAALAGASRIVGFRDAGHRLPPAK